MPEVRPISKDSGDWTGLKLWLSIQIRKLQRRLEDANPAIPERDHDVTRGKIAAYRTLIQEVEPAPRLETDKVEDQPIDDNAGY